MSSVHAELEGVGAGAVALDQQVAQPWAGGDAVQSVAVGVLGEHLLGGGRVKLGLVVVDEVGARAALVERQRRVHRLPAGGDRHVGALPLLEALVHRPLEGREELAQLAAQPRRPRTSRIWSW